ncbi:adenine phosphoribosyltransferase [archaeon]|jgi:adenine phosphoribosyltransferase|nr:adenine phosphoribosyltransferase [archaeon]NDB54478.1 adenine phosphoribosyltransferase [archaeon]
MEYKDYIRDVIDFPQKGITFRDITPLLSSQKAFSSAVDDLSILIDDKFGIVNIAGIEARGFIFGAAIAALNGEAFIPIRKEGKLPPPKVATFSTKEYGTEMLEVKECEDKFNRVIIVDDVLATGGTMIATEKLLNNAGYKVIGAVTLIDLSYLHSDIKIGGKPVYSLIKY